MPIARRKILLIESKPHSPINASAHFPPLDMEREREEDDEELLVPVL